MIYVADATKMADCANELNGLLTRVEDTIIAAAKQGSYSVRISFIKNADVLSQVEKKLHTFGFRVTYAPDGIIAHWT